MTLNPLKENTKFRKGIEKLVKALSEELRTGRPRVSAFEIELKYDAGDEGCEDKNVICLGINLNYKNMQRGGVVGYSSNYYIILDSNKKMLKIISKKDYKK